MQFFIEPSPFTNNSEQTTKTWRCYKSFDKEQFKIDLSRIGWEQALELNKNDVNTSINLFLNVINTTLNNHAPIKMLTLLLLTSHRSPVQLENLSKLKIGSANSFIEKRTNFKRKNL